MTKVKKVYCCSSCGLTLPQWMGNAVDLAVVMAIASSALDRPLPKGMVCIGEIGLGGELRPVSHMESRIREALKLGFTKAAIPVVNGDCVPRIKGIKLVALPHVSAALKILE